MRGIYTDKVLLTDGYGNTPADAGNIETSRLTRKMRGKHPRGCGEYPTRVLLKPFRIETPPRMRGIWIVHPEACEVLRNIPADAGNIRCRTCRTWWIRKHPRGCGEYDAVVDPVKHYLETPPRMRGICDDTTFGTVRDRNTPADAGNMSIDHVSQYAIWKHPRGCGENWMSVRP